MKAGLLLAAGHSRRFGAANKLSAPLHGQPLIAHAAGAMRGCDALDRRIAVIRDPALAPLLAGFDIIGASGDTLSDSLRQGLAAARAAGASQVLIALGDMPGVTPAHLSRIAAACTDQPSASGGKAGTIAPPACFPIGWFDRLEALTGDRGAGALLAAWPQTQIIPTDPALLTDIDRPEDLPG